MRENATPAADPDGPKGGHRTLGLWSIRRTLIAAFSAATGLLVAAWFFISWLLGSPPKAPSEPLDTSAQLELLKLVFGLVAGVGALVALITSYRRQRIDEVAQVHAQQVANETAHDATERRVTDLYGQAVEQLGHDKAAVRLGGLYSLERLAQDHPRHQQTIVDVVCAYLRMPFDAMGIMDLQTNPDADGGTTNGPRDNNARQELQVRLAAQGLLSRHLKANNENQTSYWDGILVDLTGARLVNLDFSDTHLYEATFRDVEFFGGATFDRAYFDGDSSFHGTRFDNIASFNKTHFDGNTSFRESQFDADLILNRAQFRRNATFAEAHFMGTSTLTGVKFCGTAWFSNARFDNPASFMEAHFKGAAMFQGASFSGASFSDAQFERDAWFRQAKFHGSVMYTRGRFSGYTSFCDAQFEGVATFEEAHFDSDPLFANVAISEPNGPHIWPDNQRTEPSSPDQDLQRLLSIIYDSSQ
ncbi:pentapeptide repeat-containing protein [Streptomyces collinus]|uniref:pentapeptide repeat-containing protein n=1 Tax=Streptomyces collinus TaxID=42684 RepID=UPI0038294174